MTWQVRWTRPATQDMRRLDQAAARRIRQAVNRYAETNYGDVEQLRGREREWRLRVGPWRVLFGFAAESGNILVLRVLPRGRAYRR